MLATAVMVLLSQDCGLEPPRAFPPVPAKAFEAGVTDPPVVRHARGWSPIIGGVPSPQITDTGALAGKTIYLSPGHGFTWEAGSNGWRTQRGTTNQIVEDLVSAETLSQFLMPMLMNAGARVVTVRELDTTTSMVIVDNGGAGYTETGTGFSSSTLKGWGTLPNPLPTGTNPFELGTNRLMDATATPTASATFTASLPYDGEYNVNISYSAFTARVTDAHYVVKHSGGESHFRVNQRRAGLTWVLLGRFHFKAGVPAVVQVFNDSADTGNVSLDAVRFGGGMGLIDRGNGKSGRPRFEESARYHAQFSGAPTSVYDYSDTDHNDDVGTRSRFSAWVHEPGEDAVYLAWHTNAFNAAAVGTDVYVYGPNGPDGTYNFTGVAGSDTLARAVHDELINDIRASAGWNQPMWRDRGVHSAYFGELNPSHNNEMPSILMEIAFHDAPADAVHLKEPLFRYLATRAITQGVIRWFAAKDGRPVVLPPESPTHVAAQVQGDGSVVVRWRAPQVDGQNVGGQAASKYVVYSSADGLGWDDGRDAASTSFSDAPGALRYYRVSAVNAGGESFPSITVAAKPGTPRVLIVNAYDRLEASQAKTENLSSWALGNVLRIFLKQLNDGTYARSHGDALSFGTLGFDTAQAEAVTSGDVTLTPYAAIDFIAGRGHPNVAPLNSAERTLLSSGKPVFFSGVVNGDAAFLAQTLHVSAVSQMSSATVTGEDFLAGVTGLNLDDGSQGAYITGTPDALTAAGATVAARYSSGSPAAVGVGSTVVTFGFPFETITSRAQRAEVMGRVMKYLGLITVVPDAGIIDPPVPDAGTMEPEPDGGVVVLPDGGTMNPEPIAVPTLPDVLGEEGKNGCGCTSGPGVFAALLAIALMRRRR